MLKYSAKTNKILLYSRDEAERLGSSTITVDHIILAILRDGESKILAELSRRGISFEKVKKDLEEKYKNKEKLNPDTQYAFDNKAERIFKLSQIEAMADKSNEVEPDHLFLGIIREGKNYLSSLLDVYEIKPDDLKDFIREKPIKDEKSNDDDDDRDDDENEDYDEDRDEKHEKSTKKAKSNTPVLDNFGFDMTQAARDGMLDPIVGREREIERVIQILSRRKKNNPVLIGEPGVGKSAIVEGLALRIIQKKVPRLLYKKRIVSVDLASIVAGTKYRGQFEERMKSLINELSQTDDVIIFIDEIHTLVGAGGASGSLDASNMLKPALARGEIQCIGATTLDEYRQNIEKDGALERRFQKVLIDPPNLEETINILKNIKSRYEEYHNVSYTDDAIEACVKLSDRYVTDRELPDKAIDVMDEAGSRVHLSRLSVPEIIEQIEKEIAEVREKKNQAAKSQAFELAASYKDEENKLTKKLDLEIKKWEKSLIQNPEIVNIVAVEEVVAMMTGVPVHRIAQGENERLKNMRQMLKSKIVGQDQAVDNIVRAIQRNRTGLKDPNRPIGSFIFLGPTGVGKTYLAKLLAEYLFDTTEALVRIDMSEYMEKFSVSRLIGAPPGYVGYEEGGQLTEKIRRKPYSIVLLDEIEKAHPDVFNILLQVLDEGFLTDSLGRRVDFKNTVIIMTSNIGTRELENFGRGIGFGSEEQQDDKTQNILKKALRKVFTPEFLNRIDEVVIFNSLERNEIVGIVDIELERFAKRVAENGYIVEIPQNVKDFIVEKGLDKKYGARPIRRAIQKYLEDEIAAFIIENSIEKNSVLTLDYDPDNDKMIVSKKG